MILKALICAALLLAALQTNARDRFAALIFLTPVVIINIIGGELPGELYYFACAGLDRGVLFFLISAGVFPELALAAFVAIVLSFFGWALWTAYLPPMLYNTASLLYFVWVLCILAKGSGIYAGIKRAFDSLSRYPLVRGYNLQSVGKAERRKGTE